MKGSNIELAKECLRLIRDIAERGESSQDPKNVGYAIQELSQVLLERTARKDRVFEPTDQLQDLERLHEELAFVDTCSQSMVANPN